jgi:hypothetical protein
LLSNIYGSTSLFYEDYAAYIIFIFGFAGAIIEIKIIICTTAKQRFGVFHFSTILVALYIGYFKLFAKD